MQSNPVEEEKRPARTQDVLTLPAVEYLKMSMFKLEKGDFNAALEDLNLCIMYLTSDKMADTALITQKLHFCERYKRALGLLGTIQESALALPQPPVAADEELVQELAAATQTLADVNLLPRHRVICLRIAVRYNMLAQRYNVAEKYLAMLIAKALPDVAQLQVLLKECQTGRGEIPAPPPFHPDIFGLSLEEEDDDFFIPPPPPEESSEDQVQSEDSLESSSSTPPPPPDMDDFEVPSEAPFDSFESDTDSAQE